MKTISRGLLTAVAVAALLLFPATAGSLELFDGNLGYDGEWLHVIDAPGMGNSIYWQDLGVDFTYDVNVALDDGFGGFGESVVQISEVETNYAEMDLPVGDYVFRVREVDASGAAGSWSDTGSLTVIEDLESPKARILRADSVGDVVSIELEVSDDTVLRLARFTINGEYAGAVGLKTENFKIKPSFGQPRIVVFEHPLPKGKKGQVTISVVVSDVTYKYASQSVVLGTEEGATGGPEKKKGGGRGPKK